MSAEASYFEGVKRITDALTQADVPTEQAGASEAAAA
jgi:hypothetical protein